VRNSRSERFICRWLASVRRITLKPSSRSDAAMSVASLTGIAQPVLLVAAVADHQRDALLGLGGRLRPSSTLEQRCSRHHQSDDPPDHGPSYKMLHHRPAPELRVFNRGGVSF
jgi:hypothetical protein